MKKIKKARKISKERVLRIFLGKVISGLLYYFPYNVVYSIHQSDKNANHNNGWISVSYIPTQREITFTVYKDYYTDFDYPLPQKQKI